MQQGIPAGYRDAVNPLTSTAETLSRGAELYEDHCASCHGATGEGGGPMAADLDPAPPELRSMLGTPMITDGYLLWAVSDGGADIGTAMPAFLDVLTIEERWRVILFMKNGFAR
jgi:mono/diheme cytochrome c family protein